MESRNTTRTKREGNNDTNKVIRRSRQKRDTEKNNTEHDQQDKKSRKTCEKKIPFIPVRHIENKKEIMPANISR